MKNILSQYLQKGEFSYCKDDKLDKKCNAPKDHAGVYIVKDAETKRTLYVGSSGKVCQNGNVNIRIGGIYDRIVNGKQFNERRCYSWPTIMSEQSINRLQIEWYVTFNDAIRHIPAYVEAQCIQQYFEENGVLPKWNIKL
ncbi:MAG: hypothetical protein ACOJUL_12830 [Candidatus Pollutiaquabacter aromativorans]